MLSRDTAAIAGAVGILIGLFLFAGLFYWALFILCFGLVLGAFEYYLWRTKDETLSSQFWKLKKERPLVAWILLILLAAFFLFLLIHLGGVSLNY